MGLLERFLEKAPAKMEGGPPPEDFLQWLGIAQHYGLPTRLLDWTTKPFIALYFALQGIQSDGAIYVMNPTELNRCSDEPYPGIFSGSSHGELFARYARAGVKKRPSGLPAIAINPLWNCPRVEAQDGKFTLHGDKYMALNGSVLESLVCIPILRRYKRRLADELNRVGGVSVTDIYPELEYLCEALRAEAKV